MVSTERAMYSLFNPVFNGGRTARHLPIFDYITLALKGELVKVQTFYRTNILTVPNNHILTKILMELTTPCSNLSYHFLVKWVRANSARFERTYNLNSSVVGAGIISNGTIYNRNHSEAWISVAYDFDVDKCVGNYKDLKPIRAISHEYTNLTMSVPNGNYPENQEGLAVLTIDLALLALQYKCWIENEQYIKEKDTYLPLHSFIYRYPLTNLISTHTDVCIFNRLYSLVENKPIVNTRSTNSFFVIDYGDRTTQSLNQLLDMFKKQPGDYVQRLNSIPSIEYGSYLRSIGIPDMAPTRQIKWVLVLARLKTIELLLMLDELTESKTINLTERDIIARELRGLINDKSFLTFAPNTVNSRINRVYALVNRE